MKTNPSVPACIEILEARIAPAAVAAIDLADLIGANGFKLSGVADNDRFGFSVSDAGDVNGDGFADLIIGATGDDARGSNSGASYVIFGKAGGFGASLDLSTPLDGFNGFKLRGEFVSDSAGSSVSAAGDVNGDGFDDLIIGAPNADVGGNNRGASYVVFGKADFSATAGILDLAALGGSNGFKLSGVADGDAAGFSVSAAGDVNGDGFDDVIIGAKYAAEGGTFRGASYVVFGKAGGFASMALSALDGSNGFKLSGLADFDDAGFSVSAAGDVNGDGFDDLIIGARRANESAYNRGASYVVFGKAGGFGASLDLSTLDGFNGFKLSGVADDDQSGSSVSAAGDVNGDGFDDLIIGARNADGGTARGASYVVFGKAGFFGASVALAGLTGFNGFKLSGVADNDNAGQSVSAAGDVNGDGFDDLIIGAPDADEGGDDLGAAYVVFGFGTADVNIGFKNRIAGFTDWDGDLVTIKTTAGTLDPAQFKLSSPNPITGGSHLIYADFTAPVFANANLTFTAKRGSAGGDGLVNIGTIDARGVTLGKVTVDGDLQQLDAAGAAGLTVYSMGQFAAAEVHGAPLTSAIDFKLGALTVKTTASRVTLAAQSFGAVKALRLDGVEIFAAGVLDPAKVANALAIKSLTIGGDVSHSRILAGYNAAGSNVNADVTIGAVKVAGNWIASELVAGVGAGFDGRFATGDDVTLFVNNNPTIAKIASITIVGAVFGTLGDRRDSFGFAAQEIGSFTIGKAKLPLTKGASNDSTPLLVGGLTGDVRVREVV